MGPDQDEAANVLRIYPAALELEQFQNVTFKTHRKINEAAYWIFRQET
jgi:hypothetical protein